MLRSVVLTRDHSLSAKMKKKKSMTFHLLGFSINFLMNSPPSSMTGVLARRKMIPAVVDPTSECSGLDGRTSPDVALFDLPAFSDPPLLKELETLIRRGGIPS